MKWGVALFSFFFLFPLYSAPAGNPAAPMLIREGLFLSRDVWIDVRAGYEGDFVGDGRLSQSGKGTRRVDTFQQYTNSATAALNVLDRLDLFGVFGSSRAVADWRFITPAGIVQRIQLETFYCFLWGVGGRGIVWEWGKACLGLSGRYAFCNYKPSWLAANAVPEPAGHARFFWQEWQAGLALSYQMDLFTPYLGVKYSHAQARSTAFPEAVFGDGSNICRFQSRTPAGFFLGCSISNGKYFLLNIEGRLVDEDAVTLSGDLRF